MKTDLQQHIQMLKEKCDHALHQLITIKDHPCRGQVYTYKRGNTHYVKWQTCVDGKRQQKTYTMASMDTLLMGIAAQKDFHTLLNTYYDACDRLMQAVALAKAHDVACDHKKKRRLSRPKTTSKMPR